MEGSANSRMVQVAKGGTFLGEAEVETAEIRGNFEGQLTVSNKLIVRSTGKVSGKIQYLGIQIELGGKISGEVQVTPDKRSASPSQVSDRPAEPEEPADANMAS
jgi:cytoskeletal protein CcmA (bactofilin family)